MRCAGVLGLALAVACDQRGGPMPGPTLSAELTERLRDEPGDTPAAEERLRRAGSEERAELAAWLVNGAGEDRLREAVLSIWSRVDAGEAAGAAARIVATPDAPRGLRVQAAALLGGLGAAGADALLAVEATFPWRREWVDALGRTGDPRALPPLLAELEAGGAVDVRCAAARALAGFPSDATATGALIRAARGDPANVVHEAALRALFGHGDPAVDRLYTELSGRGDVHHSVRDLARDLGARRPR